MDYTEIWRTFQEHPNYRMVFAEIKLLHGFVPAYSGSFAIPKYSYLNDEKVALPYDPSVPLLDIPEKKEAVDFLTSIGFIEEQTGPALEDSYPIEFIHLQFDVVNKYEAWEQAYIPIAVKLGENIS